MAARLADPGALVGFCNLKKLGSDSSESSHPNPFLVFSFRIFFYFLLGRIRFFSQGLDPGQIHPDPHPWHVRIQNRLKKE